METFPRGLARLGFGLMRLPRKDGAIDLPQTCEMVDRFLAAGCSYLDTAYVYDGSEDAAREALVRRHPRDSFLLATKLAAWAGCHTREDAIRQFETSLARTGAGHFDFYLFHNLGPGRTETFDASGSGTGRSSAAPRGASAGSGSRSTRRRTSSTASSARTPRSTSSSSRSTTPTGTTPSSARARTSRSRAATASPSS